MSIRDKLFLICFAILLFLSFGIAGNIELDQPIPFWGIVVYVICAIYCFGRIIYFDLCESEEE